jgi:hypothetical protein
MIGQIITLLNDKSHGEGQSLMSIRAGIVGIIVNTRSTSSGTQFVVDFGNEGQWNCTRDEISLPLASMDDDDEIDEDEPVEWDDDEEDEYRIPPPPESVPSLLDILTQSANIGRMEPVEEQKVPDVTIDFEKDLEIMMKKLEKEKRNAS